MEEIEVPSFFICPISLQIMRDPVTMCTGITYDRESVEKWIFSYKNKQCPVTKQLLTDTMIPNHTLRRLIQQWCTENASHGVERIPTPKPPVDTATILSILQDFHSKDHGTQLRTLLKLKTIVSESDRNKNCARTAGTAKCLAGLIQTLTHHQDDGNETGRVSLIKEALSLLHVIEITEEELKDLAAQNVNLIEPLTWVLLKGDYQSRTHACFVLKMVFEGLNPVSLMSVRGNLLDGIVQIVKEQISQQATKCALQVLIEVCKWGRNRVKVVDCGAIPVLIDLKIETSDKRLIEILMWLLDVICGCAEGRAELIQHAAGIATVSRKMMRVSVTTNDRAVRILYSLCKYSANPAVIQEMLQVGAVSKLWMVLQLEGDTKTKEKAKKMLRLHSKTWMNSPCAPYHVLSGSPFNKH